VVDRPDGDVRLVGIRKFNAPDEHKQHPLFIALGGLPSF
jgi:hypothetical protein